MAYESLRLAAHRAVKDDAAGDRTGMTLSAAQHALLQLATGGSVETRERGASILREFIGERSTRADSPKAPATATKPAARTSAAPTAPAARFTQADVNAAVGLAIANERARIRTVFASPASHGRERVCADLLTAPQGFTGANIAKELAHLPTDRDRAAKVAAKGNPRVDAVWDKANAAIDARRISQGARARADQILAHQRASGSPYVKPAAQSDAAKERSAGDAWDRAAASLSRTRGY